ncbi:hypothetical protein [Methylobacterium sp. NPDC017609]|uniref:hypothetical protein n=1 Tax=unclassified Methylobacterium TaxID=2615210 RepID=UPI0037AFC920
MAKGAISSVQEIGRDLLKFLGSKGKKEIGKIKVDFEIGFATFLERNYKALSKIKTPLNPKSPVSLESTFEAPTITLDGKS